MNQETTYRDNLCLGSDLEAAFRNYRPSPSTTTYQGVLPEDGVALSLESDEYEDEDDGLCCNLMAAWG